MRKYKAFGVGLLLAILGSACAPQAEDQVQTLEDNGLTEEQVEAADEIPSSALDFADVDLPTVSEGLEPHPFVSPPVTTDSAEVTPSANLNGEPLLRESSPRVLGPQGRRKKLVVDMVSAAYRLTNRSQWQFPEEGSNAPAQNGLAYSYGAKDPKIRQKPPAGNCTEEVHGLDCSGLINQAARAAGVPLVVGPAAYQGTTEAWDGVLPSAWKVHAEDVLGSELESGDIISWGFHIGILARGSDGKLHVLQSNGTSARSCKNACSNECIKNRGPTRGPRSFYFADAVTAFGSDYTVVRLVAELAPEWDFSVRCVGESKALATLKIKLDENENWSFSQSAQGVTAQGKKFALAVQGLYDSGKRSISGKVASGSFDLKMDFDDSGYFKIPGAKLPEIGCAALEGRWVSGSP